MEDLPLNRLRTLSNLRADDPYFYNNFAHKMADELMEDNEEKYGQNALESCIKPTRTSFMFEYLNCVEYDNNLNKFFEKKEEYISEDKYFSTQYQY
jgi:hypothetical protein